MYSIMSKFNCLLSNLGCFKPFRPAVRSLVQELIRRQAISISVETHWSCNRFRHYPLVISYSSLWKMAIEIVVFPLNMVNLSSSLCYQRAGSDQNLFFQVENHRNSESSTAQKVSVVVDVIPTWMAQYICYIVLQNAVLHHII